MPVAIFPWAEEEGVCESKVPDGEKEDEERVETASREEVEVLCTEGRLEDE